MAYDSMPLPIPAQPVTTIEEQLDRLRAKQRTRALMLVIKAKLESVESGVETFEEAFLPNIVMPDGKTVGQLTLPTIQLAYTDGKQPPLMLPSY